MSLVLKRRVGQSVVARPAPTGAGHGPEELAASVLSPWSREAADWRISLAVVEIRPHFAVLQVETTPEISQIGSERHGMHFLTPKGEEVAIRVDVRGQTATFVIDAPSSVRLLRGELEGRWRRAAARPVSAA
jgi:hypothetical protein